MTLSFRVKNRPLLSVFLKKYIFYEETKRRLRSGSIYPSYHTNLVKQNQAKIMFYFEELFLRFGDVLNLDACLRRFMVMKQAHVVNTELNPFFRSGFSRNLTDMG